MQATRNKSKRKATEPLPWSPSHAGESPSCHSCRPGRRRRAAFYGGTTARGSTLGSGIIATAAVRIEQLDEGLKKAAPFGRARSSGPALMDHRWCAIQGVAPMQRKFSPGSFNNLLLLPNRNREARLPVPSRATAISHRGWP